MHSKLRHTPPPSAFVASFLILAFALITSAQEPETSAQELKPISVSASGNYFGIDYENVDAELENCPEERVRKSINIPKMNIHNFSETY